MNLKILDKVQNRASKILEKVYNKNDKTLEMVHSLPAAGRVPLLPRRGSGHGTNESGDKHCLGERSLCGRSISRGITLWGGWSARCAESVADDGFIRQATWQGHAERRENAVFH